MVYLIYKSGFAGEDKMISQVSLHVKHLQGSISFYEKYIGIKVVRDLRKFGAQIVFMAADENDETRLELIQSDESYQGSGISVCFLSDHFEEQREYYVREGLIVTDIISPAPGVRFFFVTDPNGLQVQIMPE